MLCFYCFKFVCVENVLVQTMVESSNSREESKGGQACERKMWKMELVGDKLMTAKTTFLSPRLVHNNTHPPHTPQKNQAN